MKKVGILGGTFDPIHNGHLAIAECACNQLKLEFVLFMPNKKPVYKNTSGISDYDRSMMIKLAIKGNDSFIFSDFEISREESSFTSVTLTRLKKLYQDWEIYYIVGADSLCSMSRWKNPQLIFDNAVIVSAYRETESLETIDISVKQLRDNYDARIKLIKNDSYPFSSTEIRNSCMTGKSISGMVPKEVEEYIIDRGLYHGF